MKSLCTMVLALLFGHTLYGQPEQFIINSSFESVSQEPDDISQISFATGWTGSTADLYGMNATMSGPCPYAGGGGPTAAPIIAAQPKMTTPSGTHYAGIGANESISTILKRDTYANSYVKVKFKYALRGYWPNNNYQFAITLKNDFPGNNSAPLQIDTLDLPFYDLPVGTYNTCTWYEFESDWILVGPTFSHLMISGIGGVAGEDVFGETYLYLDDVELWNGDDCCQILAEYSEGSQVPESTHVKQTILMEENVNLISDSYSLRAGNRITIQPGINLAGGSGTVIIDGAQVTMEIMDCNSQTLPTGAPLEFTTPFPNVFTPNGDGVNDEFCLFLNGAVQYNIQVYHGEWGNLLYYGSGPVLANFACVWDGTCNASSCLSSTVPFDESYAVVVEVSGCEGEIISQSGMVYLSVDPPGRFAAESESDESSKGAEQENQFTETSIFPNPGSGMLYFTSTEVILTYNVFDATGKLIASGNHNSNTGVISFPPVPGFYIVELIGQNGSVKKSYVLN